MRHLILLVTVCSIFTHCSSPAIPTDMILVSGPDQTEFLISKTEVTNENFEQFVTETGYITTAEKAFTLTFQSETGPFDSLIQAGSLVFQATSGPVPLDDFSQWWAWTPGAYWAAPEGPSSDIKHRMHHPVVHVSYEDALAYASWKKMRLPTETEWEFFARGGKEQPYAWGDTPADEAHDKANFWQGIFPYENRNTDGFEGTAPVASFEPNGYGLFDMSGNVWEWCVAENGTPLVKGGSFLCNDSYCSGYLINSRMPNDRESSLNHTGFRLVKDL